MTKETLFNVINSAGSDETIKISMVTDIENLHSDYRDNSILISIGGKDVHLDVEEAEEIIDVFEDFIRDIRYKIKENNEAKE